MIYVNFKMTFTTKIDLFRHAMPWFEALTFHDYIGES